MKKKDQEHIATTQENKAPENAREPRGNQQGNPAGG